LKKSLSLRDFEAQIQFIRRQKHPGIRIFNYHQISEKFDPRYHLPGTFTTVNQFKDEVKKLKKRYPIISLEEAANQLKSSKITNNFACITIDDGDSSITTSAEILHQQNIPATFFINSAYIDNQETVWYRVISFLENSSKHIKLLPEDIRQISKVLRKTDDSKLYRDATARIAELFNKISEEYNGHVTKNELTSISQHGFGIASHGFRHERFALFEKEWQIENIRKDVEILSSYKTFCKFFALPFGRFSDFNLNTQISASDMELDLLLSTGGVNSFSQPFIHRIPSDSRNLRRAEIADQEIY
jgi:peptidoglycan/xylan/chitin deacetylase (PgdA/CDA1 family)